MRTCKLFFPSRKSTISLLRNLHFWDRKPAFILKLWLKLEFSKTFQQNGDVESWKKATDLVTDYLLPIP